MSNHDIVIEEIIAVAHEQQKALAPLIDTLPLLDSGLDSLCLAIIVTRLEERLGLDPFATAEAFSFPVTVGDFTRLYQRVHA